MDTLLSFTFFAIGAAWILLVLSIFLMRALILLYNKKRKETKAGFEMMVADAVILETRESKRTIENSIRLILLVQVKPVKGRNFIAEIKSDFPLNETAPVKAGDRIKVSYDPRDNRRTFLLKAA